MTISEITETALYMTFELDDETFAIDVAQVREVLDMSPITKVPRAPEFMRGVTNVRGSVVPVIDLRTKFGMPKAESTVNTRIIIMEIVLGSKTSVLGAIADSVNDVLELEPGQIEAPPDLGDRWRSEFIKGIGKKNEQFIILIDVDRVFSSDDLLMVEGAGGVSSQASEKADVKPEEVPQQAQAVITEQELGKEESPSAV